MPHLPLPEETQFQRQEHEAPQPHPSGVAVYVQPWKALRMGGGFHLLLATWGPLRVPMLPWLA